MINNVVLMGRITHDLELKSTATGVSVVSFTLAVERAFAPQGEKRQADFIDCVAWRNTAEFITNYFKKGSMIAVAGKIQTRNYEDKNGNKRKAVEVLIDTASFCGDKSNNTAPSLNVPPPANDVEKIDDSLPF